MPGAGGRGDVFVNGEQVASGRMDRTIPFFTGTETADVGMDDLTPVTHDYEAYDNKFTGTIRKIVIGVHITRSRRTTPASAPRSALQARTRPRTRCVMTVAGGSTFACSLVRAEAPQVNVVAILDSPHQRRRRETPAPPMRCYILRSVGTVAYVSPVFSPAEEMSSALVCSRIFLARVTSSAVAQ